jgi:propanediol dehydratase small subunit
MSDPTVSDPTVSEPTLDGVRSGAVSMQEFRITPQTLQHQAGVARQHANAQLAENFERAAELALLDDEEVLAIYEQLRPRRASADELETRAAWLAERGAHRCAALVREAAQVYARRGLLRAG